ncbi:MAG: LuxR C-terminal-related transcriptional regulator [Cytophagales bacterium]|nr:LuxR C-terminal-related transcriptional regulator [Cytophagales bacterium]
MSISERTVETHRKNAFRKTGSNNRVGLPGLLTLTISCNKGVLEN